MNIKVIGMGCDRCDTLHANVLEAIRLLGCEATVDKVEDLVEIVKLGVLTAPSLMIDGKLISSGVVSSVETVCEQIRKAAK